MELVWRDGCGPAADDDPDGQPPMPNPVEEANAHLVTEELKAAEAVEMESRSMMETEAL